MPNTIIYCSPREMERWPVVAGEWATLYPQLFDEDDVRLIRKQRNKHFAEWFAAIHLFHRDGVLSLVEKYIFETHPRKLKTLEKLKPDLLETLRQIKRDTRVQPPDLLLYSQRRGLVGFAEVKGPRDRREPSRGQLRSYLEIRRRLGVPVEVIKVRFADNAG